MWLNIPIYVKYLDTCFNGDFKLFILQKCDVVSRN